jgi:hypothetical protein
MLVRKTRHHTRTLLSRPTFVSPSLKPLLRLGLLFCGLAVLVPLPALGAVSGNKDTVPCWKRLMNDWYTGTIKHTYAPACYRAAIKNMPNDLKIYSSAREDIQHALLARLEGKPIPPESGTPPSTTAAATTTTGGAGPGTSTTPGAGGGGPGPGGPGPYAPATPPTTTTPHKTGISLFFAKLTPGDSQAFPLPLLILGALAILLVAAGGVGMLWQRSHPRDEPPPA